MNEELSLIYVRTCRVRNDYRTGHVDVSGIHTAIDAFMLQRGRALNAARPVTVADDSFPVLATLPPRAVRCELSSCLFWFRSAAVFGERSSLFFFLLLYSFSQ
jgi:hypothetical protein